MLTSLTALMEGVADRLQTIAGLRVFAYPPDNITPPAAVVAFPIEIAYDLTMARGSDRVTIPVHIVVGKVSDRSAALNLSEYLSGSGDKSVKSAIEADVTFAGAVDTARVETASVSVMSIAGIDYLAATFDIDIVA